MDDGPKGESSPKIWSPPIDPFIRVNFDAGYYKDLQGASISIVFRNHGGLLMGAASYWKEHLPSIPAAEALAALEAVRFAILGFHTVEFEEDSAVIIAKFQYPYNDRSEVSGYIWGAKHLVLQLERFKFQHIK